MNTLLSATIEHGERDCSRPNSETFVCDGCLRIVCWCFGGDDEGDPEGNVCNRCWCEREGHEWEDES